MIYLELFLSYLKIGFFGFGGGYSMLSLIQHEVVVNHGWISSATLSDIIAISQMTPGPIAINSATYIGYTVAGFWGSVIATTAVCLPSLTIMVVITQFFLRLKDSKYMECFMTAMRPSVIAMIAVAAILLIFPEDEGGASMIDAWSWVIFAVAFLASMRRFSPIKLIVLSAVAGIAIYYLPVVISGDKEGETTEQIQSGVWNNFDMTDTEVIASTEFEQKWVDYLFKLQSYNPKYAAKLIREGFEATTANPDATIALFDFTEKYLYDPNSPIPNEELFIPVLEFVIEAPEVDELLKLRPASLLELVMKNRKGEVAADFKISRTQSIHQVVAPYTMLYIFDPDCSDCKRVKGVMEASQLLQALERDGEVNIVRMSTTNSEEVDSLYDIKAIPTIYLLDQDKKVVLKDAPIESVLEFLHKIYVE